MLNKIRSDAIIFRDSFLSEASPTKVDEDCGVVLRVLLFYIWRGCLLSRKAGLAGKADPHATLIALSAYEALLGLLQLIRIGYHADAMVLGRSLLERISIIGYLGDHRELIPRYKAGGFSPYKEAKAWAKVKAPQNWMLIYGQLSNVVHSQIVGPAGHINNRNQIGTAFREIHEDDNENDSDLTEVLLGEAIYLLAALDQFALILINDEKSQAFLTDPDLVRNIGFKDVKEFQKFLETFISHFGDLKNIPAAKLRSTGRG